MTYLALRKTDAPGFLPKLFSQYTRWRLHTDYPHAGVSDGTTVWHITGKGLQQETVNADWLLVPTAAKLDPAKEYENLKDVLKYDFFSLLAFQLPVIARDSSRMYCYEWAWFIMTGESPIEKITPEKLLVQAQNDF